MEVARDALDREPGEVWLVELAGIVEPEHLASAIAAVLGVRDSGERPLVETLVDSLGDRQALVLLDNCEHLAAATAGLALRLLQGCPRLRVLAASRVPLDLNGETVWPVAPLAVPAIERMPARASLTRYAAVRLFVERGRAGLDGLPLAIELAAARLKVRSTSEILAGLDDRFTLLVSNDRAMLPRHRTLRATLDWSYGLLGEPERVLFQQLAPFVGGWSLDAVERIGDHRRVIERDLAPLQILTRLVEHSLVVVEERGQATRYRFLETVQHYADERLEESGKAAGARGDYLLALLDLAWRARSGIVTSEQRVWCERLDAELDNIRAGLTWACDAPQTPVAGPPGVDTALEAAPAPPAPPASPAPPVATFCSPRPNIAIASLPALPGQLQATIATQTLPATPANTLQRITIARLEDATAVLNSVPVAAGATVLLPAGTTQITLLIQRQNPAAATMVSFVLTDVCGDWPSFVGGGPGAF